MKYLVYTLGIIIMSTSFSFAQKLDVLKGNPSIIKGEKVDVIYSYENMRVGKMTEEDYVSKKKMDKNAKDLGAGDKWEEAWLGNRDLYFHAKFEELANKYFSEEEGGTGTTLRTAFKDTKYTMIVHTKWTEPGHMGMKPQPAVLNQTLSIVETANMDKVLVKIELNGSKGNGYEMGSRISQAYAKAGKELAKQLEKKYFK